MPPLQPLRRSAGRERQNVARSAEVVRRRVRSARLDGHHGARTDVVTEYRCAQQSRPPTDRASPRWRMRPERRHRAAEAALAALDPVLRRQHRPALGLDPHGKSNGRRCARRLGVAGDQMLGIVLLQMSQRKKRSRTVPRQTFESQPVGTLDAHRAIHREAAVVRPGAHLGSAILVETRSRLTKLRRTRVRTRACTSETPPRRVRRRHES